MADEMLRAARLRAALRDVRGYFSVDEAFALETAVIEKRARRVVEIGSYKGRSTIAIGLGLQASGGGQCWSIDPHAPTGKASYTREHGSEDTFDEFLRNIESAGISSFIVPIRAISVEALDVYDRAPIDVLFIDGSHDYEDVTLDIECWTPFVTAGSIVAFNDPYAPGVNRAIRDYLRNRETAISGAYHVNNTLFLERSDSERRFQRLRLSMYLFVERQRFRLWKLALRGIFERLGIVYRAPDLRD